MRVPRRFRCCSKFSLITSDSQAGPLHKLSKHRLAELIPMHRARRTRQSYRRHRRGEPSRHTGAWRFLSPSGAQPRLSNGFAEPRRSNLNAQTKPSAARHSPPIRSAGSFYERSIRDVAPKFAYSSRLRFFHPRRHELPHSPNVQGFGRPTRWPGSVRNAEDPYSCCHIQFNQSEDQ